MGLTPTTSRLVFDVTLFGAVGDGSTDDLTAIGRAVTAASTSGGTVWFPRKTFKVSDSISCSSSNVVFDGEPGATITGSFSNVANGNSVDNQKPLLLIKGTRTSGVTTVSADIAKGATSLTVASTTSLAAGDYLSIRSSAEVFSYEQANHYKGEIARIKSIDSSTALTLTGPTADSYATASGTITVDKLAMLTGNAVRNLRFLGTGTGDGTTHQVGVVARYVLGTKIENVRVEKTEYVGIQIGPSLRVVVDRCDCQDINESITEGASVGLGYGIQGYGASELTISKPTGRNCRHLVDVTAFTPLPMSRNVKVVDGLATDSVSTGFSSHGGCERVIFENCESIRCGGGFIVRGKYNTLSKCRAFGYRDTSDDYGGAFVIGTATTTDLANDKAGTGVRVIDCSADITMAGTSTNTSGLICYSPLIGAEIARNFLSGFNAHGIDIRAYTVRDTAIEDNDLDGGGQQGTYGTTFTLGIWIRPATHATGRNQKRLFIRRNRLRDIHHNGIQIEGNDTNADPSTDIVIEGNTGVQIGRAFVEMRLRTGTATTTYFDRVTIANNRSADAVGLTGTTSGVEGTSSGSMIRIDSAGLATAPKIVGNETPQANGWHTLGIPLPTKAGAFSDADFTMAPPNNTLIGLDTTNNRLYVKASDGTYKYVALT